MGVIQRISKKIANLLTGDSEQGQSTEEIAGPDVNESVLEPTGEGRDEQPKKEVLPNSVEIRRIIKKATLSMLNSLYLTNPERCKTKHLIIWFDTDTMTFNAFVDLGQELENYWSVESGYMFEKVELKQGRPEKTKDARKVDVGMDSITIYLQEREEGSEHKNLVKKACISIFENRGRLVQERYVLSSEALEKEYRKYYNIGRGEFPDMGESGHRQNHIAIDDKSDLETNRFVSRTHARIGYSKTIGFYLQVEYGGSRLSGNRTRILRGEKKIEVENTDVKEPLYDGDLIELGKAVVLKFVEIE